MIRLLLYLISIRVFLSLCMVEGLEEEKKKEHMCKLISNFEFLWHNSTNSFDLHLAMCYRRDSLLPYPWVISTLLLQFHNCSPFDAKEAHPQSQFQSQSQSQFHFHPRTGSLPTRITSTLTSTHSGVAARARRWLN